MSGKKLCPRKSKAKGKVGKIRGEVVSKVLITTTSYQCLGLNFFSNFYQIRTKLGKNRGNVVFKTLITTTSYQCPEHHFFLDFSTFKFLMFWTQLSPRFFLLFLSLYFFLDSTSPNFFQL